MYHRDKLVCVPLIHPCPRIPVPSLVWYPGPVPTRLSPVNHPSLAFALLRWPSWRSPRPPVPLMWSAQLQLTLICDIRAMLSMSRSVPSPPFAVLRCPSQHPFCGPPSPLFSLVVRAAAANVNPRTRLSHMTPFSGRDWCTRERCRPMMQNS